MKTVYDHVILHDCKLCCNVLKLHHVCLQGRRPARVDRETFKELVQKQIEAAKAAKPLRAPWYRQEPAANNSSKTADVGTGSFIPSYAQVSLQGLSCIHTQCAPFQGVF